MKGKEKRDKKIKRKKWANFNPEPQYLADYLVSQEELDAQTK